jgi:hypothetical protein
MKGKNGEATRTCTRSEPALFARPSVAKTRNLAYSTKTSRSVVLGATLHLVLSLFVVAESCIVMLISSFAAPSTHDCCSGGPSHS